MVETFRQRWEQMGSGQRKLLGAMGLAMVLTTVGMLAMRSRGAMTPLYSGLSPAESREIVAELARQGVQYKVSADETSIEVPSRSEPAARMQLAAAGLPRTTPTEGWEIFGKGGLAVTKGQQQAMQVRALQGSLERSIASLDNVSKANVHITLKEDSPFLDNKQPAKAAVMLTLGKGGQLGRDQAQAIAYMVARSVPDLETAQITILDSKGNLLFSDNVARGSGSGESAQTIEREIERRVQSQLDETFGLGKTKVRLTATMETERSEVTKTTYTTPNGAATGIAGKETMEQEDYSGNGTPGAKPGAVPGMAGNVIGGAGAAGAAGGAGRYTKRNEQRDFLVNEERQVTVKPGGALQRLTLGVFVDEGLKDAEEKIKAVASTAAGIDEKRGDVVNVATVKFAPSATEAFKSAGRMDMIKTILRLILNSLAMIIGLLTLRSIISALKPGSEVAGSFVPGSEPLLESGRAGEVKMIADQGGVTVEDAGVVGDERRLVDASGQSPIDAHLAAADGSPLNAAERARALGLTHAPAEPEVHETAEEIIGRVETSPVDDIAEVLRHWLEGDSNE
ncbi:MAG: flagellar M-ring protein FliF [Armatimonadetes bacterium]|nr:flagellar M-ring protein FliF [Armatimonadota bacterium]